MTAQVGDRFLYKKENYSIVAASAPIRFDPAEYGIEPIPRCTACWAGYWCDYEITADGILLKNLYINSKDDHYPEINGVSPEKGEKKSFQYMGHHLYKNLNIFMEYTGRILVGKGFLRQYYIHMGYQRAWAYEVLEELIFEGGRLVKTVDHSGMAEKLREELENRKRSDKKADLDISEFVEKSFSLDMKDKAWWIL